MCKNPCVGCSAAIFHPHFDIVDIAFGLKAMLLAHFIKNSL